MQMSVIVLSQFNDEWVSWRQGEVASTGFHADVPAADVLRAIALQCAAGSHTAHRSPASASRAGNTSASHLGTRTSELRSALRT
jgi:hypothetical protein